MQKISEIKIQVYTDGKHEYTRALIYDNRSMTWRDFTATFDGDVHIMLTCADDVRRKFDDGKLKIKRGDYSAEK